MAIFDPRRPRSDGSRPSSGMLRRTDGRKRRWTSLRPLRQSTALGSRRRPGSRPDRPGVAAGSAVLCEAGCHAHACVGMRGPIDSAGVLGVLRNLPLGQSVSASCGFEAAESAAVHMPTRAWSMAPGFFTTPEDTRRHQHVRSFQPPRTLNLVEPRKSRARRQNSVLCLILDQEPSL